MTVALTHSQAAIVRKLLVDIGQCAEPTFNGTGRYTGGTWPAFSDTEPPQPDDCVVVFDTQGVIDARTMRGNLNIHHGIQLRIRSKVKDVGELKAQELQRALAEDVLNDFVTVDSVQYEVVNFARFGPVLGLGMNVPNDKRFISTLNMLVVIRPA